jgi:hypothetical protein
MEKSTKPMRVYTVREFHKKGSPEKQQAWTLIGACFPNSRDSGFTIQLDALPFDRKLVVRPAKDDGRESPAAATAELAA